MKIKVRAFASSKAEAAAMEAVNKFLDVVAPPTALVALLLFLPSFYVYKLIFPCLSSLFAEDVRNKVVIITGASSGIGEHWAYSYARRGACLVLAARRAKSLREVGERAKALSAPDVLVVPADVSVYDDCRRFVESAVTHFGRLGHLVVNAGIQNLCLFEEAVDVAFFRPIMDVNFWGAVYPTYLALPHLKKTHGRIIAISSCIAYMPFPRLSFYAASKAAMLNFYDMLRMELGSELGVTVVTPGVVESEFTKGKGLNREGRTEVNRGLLDALIWITPVETAEHCAEGIVDGVCKRARHIIQPPWYRGSFLLSVFAPEVVGWILRFIYITTPGALTFTAQSKRLLDLSGLGRLLYPPSIQSSEIKVA